MSVSNKIEVLNNFQHNFNINNIENYQQLLFVLYHTWYNEETTEIEKYKIYAILDNTISLIEQDRINKINTPVKISIDDIYDYLIPDYVAKSNIIFKGPQSKRKSSFKR